MQNRKQQKYVANDVNHKRVFKEQHDVCHPLRGATCDNIHKSPVCEKNQTGQNNQLSCISYVRVKENKLNKVVDLNNCIRENTNRTCPVSNVDKNVRNGGFHEATCIVWNIGGLGNKLGNECVQYFFKEYDIIFLSETWLRETDLKPDFADYEILNITRRCINAKAKKGSGGQMVIFNQDKVAVKLIEHFCDHFDVIEITGVIMVIVEKKINVISCYIPPKDTTFVCSTCGGDNSDQLNTLIDKYRKKQCCCNW